MKNVHVSRLCFVLLLLFIEMLKTPKKRKSLTAAQKREIC